MSECPYVSIVIPCLNEEGYIERCLASIFANDIPKDEVEVLVVDGMSKDGTRAIVARYARRFRGVYLLDNPKRITPAALNVGIRRARGEVIMRMDAHATYDPRYISKCVDALEKHGAENAGGTWRIIPRTTTTIGKAIAISLSHRFGIGNAHYRLVNSKEPKWVDTVPFFCYRKEIFSKIGLFNEKLERGQDMEFNLRLKKAGGKTLLVPDIVSYYYARSDIKSFLQHNWVNGVWALLPFAYSTVMPISWRHLIPLVFVISLLGSLVLTLVFPFGTYMLTGIVGAYGLVNLAASMQVAIKERDIRCIFVMPVIFAMLHFGYGLGSLWGVIKLIGKSEFWVKILGFKMKKELNKGYK